MFFEWDALKSASNKLKHGISFEEVEEALAKEAPLDAFRNANYPGQEVWVFRSLEGKICSVAVEQRGGKVRFISAHQNRKMRKMYGS